MIVLGLGSNLGDRRENIRRALRRLPARVLAISPLYETAPLRPAGAPDAWNLPYLNCAALIETSQNPETLLPKLKAIENQLGRETSARWAPRTIDLDILADDGVARDQTDLHVPHLQLLSRAFAMGPLSDLWPDWKYPRAGEQFGRSARELSSALGPVGARIPFSGLIGILNVTPDSFSDGGRSFAPAAAIEHGERLLAEGAWGIDVGAESTRPGARLLSPAEEWDRLGPVLEGMSEKTLQTLSVDTRHPETVERVACVLGRRLPSGFRFWVNDVGGLENSRLRDAVRDLPVDVLMMHSLGVPPSKERVITEADAAGVLIGWAEKRLELLEAHGISRERVIMDPGLGFGKTAEQSWTILRDLPRFHSLGLRILIGHSRKSFFSRISSVPSAARDPETAAIVAACSGQGVDYFRVHDVAGSLRALRASTEAAGLIRFSGRLT